MSHRAGPARTATATPIPARTPTITANGNATSTPMAGVYPLNGAAATPAFGHSWQGEPNDSSTWGPQ